MIRVYFYSKRYHDLLPVGPRHKTADDAAAWLAGVGRCKAIAGYVIADERALPIA